MPKTDINTILKNGATAKPSLVDYSSPKKQKELEVLKKKSEQALKNKWVNMNKLNNFIITT